MMHDITLNNEVNMPIIGLGTFLLSPDDVEKAVGRRMKKSRTARNKIFFETKFWPVFL